MPDLFLVLGWLVAVFAVFFVLALAVVLALSYWFFKNRRLMGLVHSSALSLLLLFLDVLYFPSKKLMSLLGGDEFMVEVVATECRNILLKPLFRKIPFNERVVIVPQCLRGSNCPAKFSSVDGAKCVGCGACKIKDISKRAEELGYLGVFIAPGSGFVLRILKKTKPRGVIGIGCPIEVYIGLMGVSSAGLVGQGVFLLNSGCVGTDVDLGSVFEAMELS
jgi:hypothetical protein